MQLATADRPAIWGAGFLQTPRMKPVPSRAAFEISIPPIAMSTKGMNGKEARMIEFRKRRSRYLHHRRRRRRRRTGSSDRKSMALAMWPTFGGPQVTQFVIVGSVIFPSCYAPAKNVSKKNKMGSSWKIQILVRIIRN